MGLNQSNDLVMMRKEMGNDSQLWKWHGGNCFINKEGYALDVKGGGSEPGKFNHDINQGVKQCHETSIKSNVLTCSDQIMELR